jgi:hypothetical protein
MNPDPTPAPRRKGLPLWLKILLVLGIVGALLGALLFLAPLAVMFWLMGSGEQVDTLALASPESVAVFHFEPDPDDPGMAAFLEHQAMAFQDMQDQMRQAQGYPDWLVRMQAMRSQGELGITSMMPTQVTLTVEPADPGHDGGGDASVLGAINMPSWARGARLGMWFGARMQDELAEADPSIQPMQRLEVDDHTLYVQRSAGGEVFWGAIDSTLLGGAGDFHGMVSGMERMVAGQRQPMGAELQAAVDLLGDRGWEAWGAMLHRPDAVEAVFSEAEPAMNLSGQEAIALEAMLESGGGELPDSLDPEAIAQQLESVENAEPPPRSCLADVQGASAVAFAVDVVGPDELHGRLVVGVESGLDLPPAQACLRDITGQFGLQAQDTDLRFDCQHEQQDRAAVATCQLTNIEAFMRTWLEEIEAESQAQRAQALERQLPPELEELPELEGLEF